MHFLSDYRPDHLRGHLSLDSLKQRSKQQPNSLIEPDTEKLHSACDAHLSERDLLRFFSSHTDTVICLSVIGSDFPPTDDEEHRIIFRSDLPQIERKAVDDTGHHQSVTFLFVRNEDSKFVQYSAER